MIASITGTTWLMTLMGIGVVFVILVLLVFVLQIFNVLAKGTTKVVVKSVEKASDMKEQVALARASEEELQAAAVAVSLYLNLEHLHDTESGVLTIHHQDHSEWHQVIPE